MDVCPKFGCLTSDSLESFLGKETNTLTDSFMRHSFYFILKENYICVLIS